MNYQLRTTRFKKPWTIIIIVCVFISLSTISKGQSVKLTKAERKQEQKNIDSLFIVYSLPVSVAMANDFFNVELSDSIASIVMRKGYDYPDSITKKNLIVKKMFSFLPSVETEKEKYLEVMAKVAQDQNYYWRLMEMAEPFLQAITLSGRQNDAGESFIIVKRQNFPNGRKSREWTFKFDETEPIQNLAARIVNTLTNQK